MFRCENDNCKQTVPAGQPINTFVSEKRQRSYEHAILKGKNKGQTYLTHGWEIVKEIKVCPTCFVMLTGEKPRLVEIKAKPEFSNKPKRKQPYNKNYKNKRTSKNQTDSKPQKERVERKQPVVEYVNPIPIIKS